ncbi:MAG: hypothetical protein O3A51_04485 [Verrucomicrobia bacterium]|nr:hypothetical protein [Verrucomicrobiota bacterium]
MTRKKRVQDPDIRGVGPALERAAMRAREVAYRTGTPLIIWEKGRIVRKRITLEDLQP